MNPASKKRSCPAKPRLFPSPPSPSTFRGGGRVNERRLGGTRSARIPGSVNARCATRLVSALRLFPVAADPDVHGQGTDSSTADSTPPPGRRGRFGPRSAAPPPPARRGRAPCGGPPARTPRNPARRPRPALRARRFPRGPRPERFREAPFFTAPAVCSEPAARRASLSAVLTATSSFVNRRKRRCSAIRARVSASACAGMIRVTVSGRAAGGLLDEVAFVFMARPALMVTRRATGPNVRGSATIASWDSDTSWFSAGFLRPATFQVATIMRRTVGTWFTSRRGML